jgi:Flp pilus assembly protein TadG
MRCAMARARRSRERGAVAVEFALSIPALLLIVFAGLHLGRAVSARSRIVDAAGFAARSEAIAARGRPGGQVLGEEISKMVNARMAGASECTGVETTFQVEGALPYRYLKVQVTCTLSTIMTGLVGNLGLSEVSAAAAMPIDFEPN